MLRAYRPVDFESVTYAEQISAIDVKFADRKRYYDAFDSYCRSNNTYAMLEMIAKYAEEYLSNYLSLFKSEELT